VRIIEFLGALQKRGVVLHAERGKLHYDALEGALTEELRCEIVQRKNELLAFLEAGDRATMTGSVDTCGIDGNPLSLLLKFHHFGVAVQNPTDAFKLAGALGYIVGPAVFDPVQNVQLALCSHEAHPTLELIWPGPGKGPIDALIRRQDSGIVYHICYETCDLNSVLGKFHALGLETTCVSMRTPAPLFSGRNVSFYEVSGMGLIEILE